MDQTPGVVKPTGTGVEMRLRARVRSKKIQGFFNKCHCLHKGWLLTFLKVEGSIELTHVFEKVKHVSDKHQCLWSCFVSIICNIITSDECKPIIYFVLQLLIVVRYQFLEMVLYSVTWQCSQMKQSFLVILDISSMAPTQESVRLMEHGVEWKQFANVSLTPK